MKGSLSTDLLYQTQTEELKCIYAFTWGPWPFSLWSDDVNREEDLIIPTHTHTRRSSLRPWDLMGLCDKLFNFL